MTTYKFEEHNLNTNLEFTVSVTSFSVSPDLSKLLAAGTYKPCYKQYNFNDFSVKLERDISEEYQRIKFIDNENFVGLSFGKKIEFHIQEGHHESIKVKTFCRDIEVFENNLFIGGGEIYQFNLSKGMFTTSLPVSASKLSISSEISCLGYINEDEFGFYDLRIPEAVFIKDQPNLISIAQNPNDSEFVIGTDLEIQKYDYRNMKVIDKINVDNISQMKYYNSNLYFSSLNNLYVNNILSSYNFKHKINDFDFYNDLIFIGGETGSIKSIKLC